MTIIAFEGTAIMVEVINLRTSQHPTGENSQENQWSNLGSFFYDLPEDVLKSAKIDLKCLHKFYLLVSKPSKNFYD